MSKEIIDYQKLAKPTITDEALASVAVLAEKQISHEKRISDLNLLLETEQTLLRTLMEVTLPDAMLELGIESFVLSDGTAIKINKFYAASIPADKRVEAFAWLRNGGFESLIKREIKCKFGKGEDKMASKVLAELQKLKVLAEDKESVHPQTLKAFVQEQIEGGKTLPTELLGVYVGNRSKVTPANNK